VRAGALAALVLAWPVAAAHAEPLSIRDLFAALAKERPARAAFQERKFMKLLDRPLDSSGELVFTPPARLEKRTLRPRPESVVVDGDRVTIERNGKTRTVTLHEQPAVAALVDSIRSTLAGDLAALTRDYSVSLDGTNGRWRLVLRPLDASVASLVERVEIAGAQARVDTVEIFQGDGDRSVMSIAPPR